MLIYSVYDQAREAYSPLQLFDTEEAAERAFADLVNNQNGIINSTPSDFSFRCVGLFDISTGEIQQRGDFTAKSFDASRLWKEPKDDKVMMLLNKVRRLESQLADLQDQIDGGKEKDE